MSGPRDVDRGRSNPWWRPGRPKPLGWPPCWIADRRVEARAFVMERGQRYSPLFSLHNLTPPPFTPPTDRTEGLEVSHGAPVARAGSAPAGGGRGRRGGQQQRGRDAAGTCDARCEDWGRETSALASWATQDSGASSSEEWPAIGQSPALRDRHPERIDQQQPNLPNSIPPTTRDRRAWATGRWPRTRRGSAPRAGARASRASRRRRWRRRSAGWPPTCAPRASVPPSVRSGLGVWLVWMEAWIDACGIVYVNNNAMVLTHFPYLPINPRQLHVLLPAQPLLGGQRPQQPLLRLPDAAPRHRRQARGQVDRVRPGPLRPLHVRARGREHRLLR